MKPGASEKVRIGEIGEELVYEFHGAGAERVEDWYDNTRDLMIGGLKAEVKTMSRNVKGDEFWIDSSQYDKVKGVDLLFIVEIPMYTREVPVYICPNNKLLRLTTRQRHGVDVEVMAIPAKRLYKVFTVRGDPRIDEMIELSNSLSSYRRARINFKG